MQKMQVIIEDIIVCDNGDALGQRGAESVLTKVKVLRLSKIVIFSLSLSLLSLFGCTPSIATSHFDISKEVAEAVEKIITAEESKLLDYVLDCEDETRKGAISQIGAQHGLALNENGNVQVIPLFTIFMFSYPVDEFPKGRNLGLVYSDTERQTWSPTESDATSAPQVAVCQRHFSMWRIPSRTRKRIHAHVRMIIWLTEVNNKQEEHRYFEVREEFEWNNKVWTLISSENQMME